ncbi:hypothetical protein pb186bvf_011473 [Paramecium bursaria]
MEYQRLGNSGLLVSRISFGNMINCQEQRLIIEYRNYKDIGIFSKIILSYEAGLCEIQLGKSLKILGIQREKIVVATKFINYELRNGKGNPVNRSMTTNRKHILEGIDESLKRLDLDYVDIVFVHAFDQDTSIQEVCLAFNQIIEDGKAFYWATSNWPVERIQEAFSFCDSRKLIRPIAEQCKYNQISRKTVEKTLVPVVEKGYGLTVYSPLGGGFLTGKYNDGKGPEDARANRDYGELTKEFSRSIYFKDIDSPQMQDKLHKLEQLAKELGFNQTQLALAWVLGNKDVSSAIIGAKNPQQVIDCVKSIELLKIWNNQLEDKVEKILNNAPTQDLDYRTMVNVKNRRATN